MTKYVLATQSAAMAQVIDPSHPPVIRAMKAKAAVGAIRYGTFVGLNTDGLIIPWNGDTAAQTKTSDLIGVIVESIDTTAGTVQDLVAQVLVHGTVKRDTLLVDDGTPAAPTAAQVALLEALKIWANQSTL